MGSVGGGQIPFRASVYTTESGGLVWDLCSTGFDYNLRALCGQQYDMWGVCRISFLFLILLTLTSFICQNSKLG